MRNGRRTWNAISTSAWPYMFIISPTWNPNPPMTTPSIDPVSKSWGHRRLDGFSSPANAVAQYDITVICNENQYHSFFPQVSSFHNTYTCCYYQIITPVKRPADNPPRNQPHPDGHSSEYAEHNADGDDGLLVPAFDRKRVRHRGVVAGRQRKLPWVWDIKPRACGNSGRHGPSLISR